MTYTIGQVEQLTGVKAHVLRYWEEVVPGFLPKKDLAGRRVYSQNELNLIFRLKYLINNKKFTAEGAGRQILEDSQTVQNNQELLKNIQECRAELSKIYFMVTKENEK